jgi:hypothetical protein
VRSAVEPGRAGARGRSVAAPARLLLALFSLAVLAAPAARAQSDRAPIDPQRPLFLRLPSEVLPPSARKLVPLDAIELQIVQDAQRERSAGHLDAARKKLEPLSPATQHHPIVLTERGRIELAAGNWNEVIRIAAFERRTQRDSLLLGRELVEAYEHVKRPREASATAVEVWALAPAEESWALGVLARTSLTDGGAGRDAMRRACAREPRRPDLARGLARLEWTGGDVRSALRVLRASDPQERGPRSRWAFGESLLQLATARDSAGATEVYLDIAADASLDGVYRMSAALRCWELLGARGLQNGAATRLYQALQDVPGDRWEPDLSLALARGLRLTGNTAGARALLENHKGISPEASLERGLADLRDGPPERVVESLRPDSSASEEARYSYAEALFFAGQPDSAVRWYQSIAEDPSGVNAGASLERLFLIEDGKPREALPVLGRIAYEQWRGANKRALALAESLWTAVPRGSLWAHTGMIVASERERAGDARGALAAALAVADSLPEDRLAPLARQRAGDLYSRRLKDEPKALEQYEACVARYPRAWNAPEVRRRLEELRRTRRF